MRRRASDAREPTCGPRASERPDIRIRPCPTPSPTAASSTTSTTDPTLPTPSLPDAVPPRPPAGPAPPHPIVAGRRAPAPPRRVVAGLTASGADPATLNEVATGLEAIA